jgi:DNA-binding NarL/FixJ family response regulator
MGFAHEATLDEVVDTLAGIGAQMQPAEEHGAQWRDVAQFVVKGLLNDAHEQRRFSYTFADLTDPDRVRWDTYSFRLLSLRDTEYGPVVVASDQAVMLYLEGLDVDLEDADAALAHVLQRQLDDHRFEAAVGTAAQAERTSLAMSATLTDLLDETSRDVRSHDWLVDVPERLTRARRHVQTRIGEDDHFLEHVLAGLDADATPGVRAASGQIVDLLRRAKRVHLDLERRLVGAREVFLAAQVRQRLAPRRRLRLLSLAEELFVPTLGLRADAAAEITGRFADRALGAALPDVAGVGEVVYSAGNTLGVVLVALAEAERPAALAYFGDLDLRGLEIAAAGERFAAELALPHFEPAESLYRLLLEHGRPANVESPPEAGRARAAVRWLPDQLRPPALDVLLGGRRLAQEAVGLEVLLRMPWGHERGALWTGDAGHRCRPSRRCSPPWAACRRSPSWSRRTSCCWPSGPSSSVGGACQSEGVSDETVRVFLVDDHKVVRSGLAAYLATEPGMAVVGEAGDGRRALDELAVLDRAGQLPDVVLMDLQMPALDGVSATAEIKRRWPDVEVVAVTSFVEEAKIRAALEAGATGYLLKDADAGDVAAAIRSARAGEVHLDPAAAKALTAALRAPRSAADSLTPREREVLVLIATGGTNREIGRHLGVAERTARTHVSNILAKLGLASRTQAAMWAVKEGLVPAGGEGVR